MQNAKNVGRRSVNQVIKIKRLDPQDCKRYSGGPFLKKKELVVDQNIKRIYFFKLNKGVGPDPQDPPHQSSTKKHHTMTSSGSKYDRTM